MIAKCAPHRIGRNLIVQLRLIVVIVVRRRHRDDLCAPAALQSLTRAADDLCAEAQIQRTRGDHGASDRACVHSAIVSKGVRAALQKAKWRVHQ